MGPGCGAARAKLDGGLSRSDRGRWSCGPLRDPQDECAKSWAAIRITALTSFSVEQPVYNTLGATKGTSPYGLWLSSSDFGAGLGSPRATRKPMYSGAGVQVERVS